VSTGDAARAVALPAPADGRRDPRARRAWAVARVVVVAGLLALAAWRLDWSALGGAIAGSAWHLAAAAALASLCSTVLKAMTWQGLADGLPEVDGRSRWYDMVAPLLIGAMLNAFLVARMGDVAKVVLGRRRLCRRGLMVSHEAVAGTMVAEHLVATAVWGALALAAGIVLPLPGYARVTALVVGAASLGGTALAAAIRPRALGAGRAGRTGVALRVAARTWGGVHDGARALRTPGRAAYVLASGAGQWVAGWAAAMLALAAVGATRDLAAAAAVVSITLCVAHAVPLLPGNVGTFQAAAAIPLSVSFGVPVETAVAFGLLLQAAETLSNVAGGLCCLAVEGVPRREALREPA
jgi:hypothetical protein